MKKFTSKAFWLSIAERAIKTFAEAMLSVVTINGVSVGFAEVDWLSALSVSGVAVVISVLTNLATLKEEE